MTLSPKRAFLVALLLFMGGVVAELSAILFINSGHLVYTLDDAYIHLSLAENIARCHYGINPGESSSPSSSILWPFLLAPVAGSALGTAAPLVLNVLVSLGTVFLFWRIVDVSMGDHRPDSVSSTAFAALLVSLLVVSGPSRAGTPAQLYPREIERRLFRRKPPSPHSSLRGQPE